MGDGRLVKSALVFSAAIAALLVLSGPGLPALPPADASWQMFRYDLRGTGVTPLKGNIAAPEALWIYNAGADVHAPLAAGDVNNDGKVEAVFGCTDFNVTAIDGSGKLLWKYRTDSWIVCSPAIGDINGDGLNEVVVADYWYPSGGNSVYALRGTDGGLLWKFSAPAANERGFQASPVLFDVNQDGKLDILIGSWDYFFYAIDGPTGTLLWKSEKYNHMIKASSPVADIDNDGTPEVVTVDNRAVTRVRNAHTGALEWKVWVDYSTESTPLIADLDGDGRMEIVFCFIGNGIDRNTGFICALNHDGTMLWKGTAYTYYYTSPTMADVDGDGLPDVIAGDSDDSTIAAFKGSTGAVLWASRLPNSTWLNAPLISSDINSDGVMEVIVGSYPNIYCLSAANGTMVWTYQTPGGANVWGQPVVADLNGDGFGEVLFGASDGKVYCIGQPQESVPTDASLRISGRKGNSVTVVILEDGKAIARMEAERTSGKPGKDSATFAWRDGHKYVAVIIYEAEKCGSNPVWLKIGEHAYYFNFNSHFGKVQARLVALN